LGGSRSRRAAAKRVKDRPRPSREEASVAGSPHYRVAASSACRAVRMAICDAVQAAAIRVGRNYDLGLTVCRPTRSARSRRCKTAMQQPRPRYADWSPSVRAARSQHRAAAKERASSFDDKAWSVARPSQSSSRGPLGVSWCSASACEPAGMRRALRFAPVGPAWSLLRPARPGRRSSRPDSPADSSFGDADFWSVQSSAASPTSK